ncbi:hypothetical protein CLTEP_02080 [Clostridium tepidiprofundi DSM 19306]|uniref:Uncharacterized protein n=1 Tax=Clostridium tepidiprofundi DSM 19306 TaxID=1121338 RepID=A0A151B7B9_9CLOT|nr:hypothetical protein CLTEP_02080 [Clostridium tepidiprofundi DSM 19306]
MKKVYIVFSYIITFLMFLSIHVCVATYILKTFFSTFYLEFNYTVNLLLLIYGLVVSLYITYKFYTPSTNHLFRHDNYLN